VTATVHAAIGAGLGALLKTPGKAFIAGVISHHFADKTPHKEASLILDVPAVIALLCFFRARYGGKSPQFWGALGALAPDFEHVLEVLGILEEGHCFFATHRNDGEMHGRSEKYGNQVLAAFLGGLLAETRSEPNKPSR